MSTIDSGRAQWSGRRSRGARSADLSRSSSLKSRRAGVSTPRPRVKRAAAPPRHTPDSGDCGGGSVSEELAVSDAVTPP